VYFFVVGSLASEQKVLEPNSPNLLSLIGNNENPSGSTLLSQLINVSPKDVSVVIVMVEQLINKGNKEIDTLNNDLANAAQDVQSKKKEDNTAQLELDGAKNKLDGAIAHLENAKIVHKAAQNQKSIAVDSLEAAIQHYQAMKQRSNKEKPVLENQIDVLRQVLALLHPIGAGKVRLETEAKSNLNQGIEGQVNSSKVNAK
jgi:hypothetical protein